MENVIYCLAFCHHPVVAAPARFLPFNNRHVLSPRIPPAHDTVVFAGNEGNLPQTRWNLRRFHLCIDAWNNGIAPNKMVLVSNPITFKLTGPEIEVIDPI